MLIFAFSFSKIFVMEYGLGEQDHTISTFSTKGFMCMPFDNECCVLKKCCKSYKDKGGKQCKKCPKKK